MKKTVVVDLDGTLADLRHRLHLITGGNHDWESFYSDLVYEDKPNQWCVTLINALCAEPVPVSIVSARRDNTFDITRRWLIDRCRFGYWLAAESLHLNLLRPSTGLDRYTPDTVLKKRWLDNFGKDKIAFVVDDRRKVVDMWRSEGLVCLQCADWSESKTREKQ